MTVTHVDRLAGGFDFDFSTVTSALVCGHRSLRKAGKQEFSKDYFEGSSFLRSCVPEI